MHLQLLENLQEVTKRYIPLDAVEENYVQSQNVNRKLCKYYSIV